jgi:hypothetical protein
MYMAGMNSMKNPKASIPQKLCDNANEHSQQEDAQEEQPPTTRKKSDNHKSEGDSADGMEYGGWSLYLQISRW